MLMDMLVRFISSPWETTEPYEDMDDKDVSFSDDVVSEVHYLPKDSDAKNRFYSSRDYYHFRVDRDMQRRRSEMTQQLHEGPEVWRNMTREEFEEWQWEESNQGSMSTCDALACCTCE